MKNAVVVLLHIVYWLLYLLLLSLFFGLMTMSNHQAFGQFFYYCFMMAQFALLPALISFYTFYTLLFRRYLLSRKIFRLVLSAVLVAVLAALTGEVVMFFLLKFPIQWTSETVISMGIIMAFNALLNGLMGLGMKSFITWYNDIKWKEALSQKNHEMEMALVRSQINPHFLFNTINNIDVLIEKDPVRASGYLNRLSDIMRFMLYETKAEQILLSKELEYIEKYIELQKIRTAHSAYIHYEVKGAPGMLRIAPMLFIPFIENAFKHAVLKKEHAIDICITIAPDKLIFECSNNYNAGTGVKDEYSGLGNELITKRLMLLYPEKHQLEVNDEQDIYTVKLTLSLL